MRHPGYRANNGQPFGLHFYNLQQLSNERTAQLDAALEENKRLRASLDSLLVAIAQAEAKQTAGRQ